MPTDLTPARQVTELDAARIRKLLASEPIDDLASVLDEADIVPGTEVDPRVVTMYTQFELEHAATGERLVLAVCYPDDAEPGSGFVSVLSPLGRGAIGLRAGAHVLWRTPAGTVEGRIASVLFQPEASGDYVT